LTTALPICVLVLLYLRMAQVPFDIHVDTIYPDAVSVLPPPVGARSKGSKVVSWSSKTVLQFPVVEVNSSPLPSFLSPCELSGHLADLSIIHTTLLPRRLASARAASDLLPRSSKTFQTK
jgi:hypothetical protein